MVYRVFRYSLIVGILAAGVYLLVRDDRFDPLVACGYHRHSISDAAWELVFAGYYSPAAAAYYSRLVLSRNIPFWELRACGGYRW